MSDARELERTTLRRVSRRLIPFVFVLYVANFLDRVNVSFAALQMNHDLGFSGAVYGLGAGMFFVGYCLLQIPSNLMLERVGARRWIGTLMIGWGVIASAMMLVRGAASFYVLRFLLGVVEAGFFPGMILYLTYWFPAAERARAVASFMTAIPVSGLIGGPLSGAPSRPERRRGACGLAVALSARRVAVCPSGSRRPHLPHRSPGRRDVAVGRESHLARPPTPLRTHCAR